MMNREILAGKITPWIYLVEEGENEDLLSQVAKNSKHGNAAMLQLSLTQNLDIKNLGEAERVESNITGERAVKIGGLLQERNRLGERAREDSHARSRNRCTTKRCCECSVGQKPFTATLNNGESEQ